MSRRLIGALSALVIAAAGVGCGSSDDDDGATAGASTAGTTTSAQSAPKKIAISATQANAFQGREIAVAQRWADDNGAELTILDPGLDAQKQYSQIQDAIAQGELDGLLIAPLNGPALAPLVRQADAAGISTVAINYPLTSDYSGSDPTVPGLDGLVWKPLTETGELLAEQVVAACRGVDPCEAVYLSISPTLPAERAVYDAFSKDLAQHPEITELPPMGPTMAQRGPAVRVTQDLLQAHPGVDVIVSTDAALFGSEVALRQAGRTWGTGDGEVRLVGWGGTEDAVERIGDGSWSSLQITLPDETTTEALRILEAAHAGTLEAPEGVDPVNASGIPAIMTARDVEQTGFRGQYRG